MFRMILKECQLSYLMWLCFCMPFYSNASLYIYIIHTYIYIVWWVLLSVILLSTNAEFPQI